MISVGVIGHGFIGKRHCEEVIKHPDLVLDSIAELNFNKIEVSENNTSYYKDYKEHMLKPLDLVAVCTPNHLHAEMTINALNAECHVICEKPMALTKRDCELMTNAALKNDKSLFIVKQNRYNAPIKVMKEALDSIKLGKIQFMVANCYWNRNESYYANSSWKGSLDKDGGALYTQFSHYIDALLYLKNDKPYCVQSTSFNTGHPNIEIDDTGSVILNFLDGTCATINYTTNSYNKNMESSIVIFCEKGTFRIGGQYLNKIDYQESDIKLNTEKYHMVQPNIYDGFVGSAANHEEFYKNVVETLKGNKAIDVNGIEGMWAIEVIEAAYKANKIQRAVFL